MSFSKPVTPRQPQSFLPILQGKHDRRCNWCGVVISQQNVVKEFGKQGKSKKTLKIKLMLRFFKKLFSACCPSAACGRRIPYRGEFDVKSGWGRCPDCDSFTHSKGYFVYNLFPPPKIKILYFRGLLFLLHVWLEKCCGC